MSGRIVTYTAVCGDRDKLRDDIICLSGYDRFSQPRMNARQYKVLSHLWINADWSIWIDANIQLHVPPEQLVDMTEMRGAEVGVFKHQQRDCLYEEALACIQLQMDYFAVIKDQTKRYKKAGFPKNNGLAMTGVLIRKHTDRVKRLNERWWAEICRGSLRDQISFPFVWNGHAAYLDTGVTQGTCKYFTVGMHGK